MSHRVATNSASGTDGWTEEGQSTVLDSEAQRQNLLRLLDRVTITGAEAEILVELKAAIRSAVIAPFTAPAPHHQAATPTMQDGPPDRPRWPNRMVGVAQSKPYRPDDG